jgi:hypothetical protein
MESTDNKIPARLPTTCGEERLFGTIIERDGRFKFVSCQNQY